MKEDYAILGDLGDSGKGQRKYVVRVWSHGHVIDEELEAPNVPDLLKQIENRLKGMTAAKAGKAGTKGDKIDPKDWMGHAIDISEAE